jgi:hypothetical protein
LAIDTAEKRASCIGIGMPFRITLPVSSGSIDVGPRQHLSGLYAGVGAAVEVVYVAPGTALLYRDGPGAASLNRTGRGSAIVFRAGPGAATIEEK